MVLFLLLSAFSFFSLFVLGIRILQERGGRPALLFGLYAIAASFVSLLELLIRLSESLERAQLWANAAFLWPLAPAIFLHFVLVGTLRQGKVRALLISLDYVGAVVMGALYALFVQSGGALDWRYGWALTSPVAPEWPWAVSTIIASVYSVSSFALLLFRALRPGGELAPREQRWILFAYAVRFGFALAVHLVAGRFEVAIPEMNSLAYAVFAVFVYIGIARAYLLSLTPQRTVGAILSTMEELLFLTTRNHTIVTANRAAGSLLGVDSRKLRGESLLRLLGLREGEPIPGEVRIDDGRRQRRTLQILRNDVRSPAGESLGLLYVARDVTEDRRSEAAIRHTLAEKDALLHELHHRVHNTLQTVTSLLRLKAVSADPTGAVQTVTESAAMVQRIAEIHRWAYDTGELDGLRFDELLEQLCDDIYQEHRPNGEARLRLRMDPVHIDVRRAIPLLLLAGELLPNAFVAAKESPGRDEVQIELSTGVGAHWELRLTHPTGSPAASGCPDERTTEVAMALAEQAGVLLQVNHVGGLTVVVVSPL